jgi:FlaA1/EpsC-like NDP-sugar epimerase
VLKQLKNKKVFLLLLIYDIAVVNLSYFIALMLRFDLSYSLIEPIYLKTWLHFVPIYTIFCIVVFIYLNLYKSIWRFASYMELVRVVGATVVTSFFHITMTIMLLNRMPISYYLIGGLLQFLFMISIRFSYRFILLIRSRTSKPRHRVMLVGAGDAGMMILRDIRRAKEVNERVVCIIDDDERKWDKYLEDVPIVGGRNDIVANVEAYDVDKIYIALPSANAKERKEVLEICKDTDCEIKVLPGMYQLVSGEVRVSHMKKVSIEDLLGREPIDADLSEVFSFINEKTVLVTGGGGSIGSELCRQIAKNNPKKLIIFDMYENNVYDLQQELKYHYPELDFIVEIGSVRDSRRLWDLFKTYRPDIVYHAAAHKHVPLMEVSPNEAIKNNAIGTYKTAYAAMMNGCKRFVLISTDKAVNPTNIMGASKRLCEMIIQAFDAKIKSNEAHQIPELFTHFPEDFDVTIERDDYNHIETEFVAVRFGNVLGSNGSVVPLFKKQLEAGGPLTVTDPRMIRYFMTIPEAVSLVLLAGTFAKGGEIFVLDMGSPVKIDDLAKNLIRVSGFKPNVDIKIVYTGLRPGEKLYEEKLMAEEGLQKTENNLIFIGNPIPFDIDGFLKQLETMMKKAYENDSNIREYVATMVNTYHPRKETDNV